MSADVKQATAQDIEELTQIANDHATATADNLRAADRFADGYRQGKRRSATLAASATAVAHAWGADDQDTARDAIRRAWPTLASALDAATETATLTGGHDAL